MTVALIYGGAGYEREISILGFRHLFPILSEIYKTIPIFIDTSGEFWLRNKRVFPTYGGFADEDGDVTSFDSAFPLLHGNLGEDGVVQAALELSHIPYVGCDCRVGAICRDKYVVGAVAREIGIPTLPKQLLELGKRPSAPCFIKPCTLGSSIGAMAAENDSLVDIAIENARSVADRVMAEPLLLDKRELECGYFSVKGKELFTKVGEILTKGFYDYDSKYKKGTRTSPVAEVDEWVNKRIRDYSSRLVRALGVRQICRIDFFLSKGEIYFNEINTMPGFTKDSLYPAMLAASGVSIEELLRGLIEDLR